MRNIDVNYSALSELHGHCAILPGATRLTLFGACPWLSYSAPLAVSFDFRATPVEVEVTLHTSRFEAPKARNMKARGKREAQRNASPRVTKNILNRALKIRNKRQSFTHVLFSDELFKFAALMGTHGTGGMEMIASRKDDRSEEARRLGPEYQILRNWSTFTMYQKQFLQPVYADGYHFQIFKIK